MTRRILAPALALAAAVAALAAGVTTSVGEDSGAARAADRSDAGTSAAIRRPAGRIALGFTDIEAFQKLPIPERAQALGNARGAGATFARLIVNWSDVAAPSPPPDRATAQDPSWAGYNWRETDAWIRDAAVAGLEPLVTVTKAPRWAEGPGRPPGRNSDSDIGTGSWRPDPTSFGDFGTAIARRYSGTTPDPERPGAVLPRVRLWQAWNEPNLPEFLNPQWNRSGGSPTPESPGMYRRLLNAFYDGVKAANPGAIVGTGGTGPFGENYRGGRRMPPAYFWRSFFCVTGRKRLRSAPTCPDTPVRFDALAHHPYPIGPPRRKAPNRDDVVVPDYGRITGPLEVADRAGRVAPRGRKDLWATEISWESKPPDPDGIPHLEQARFLEGALNVLWRQGVSLVAWYTMRDERPDPSFALTFQSGIFRRGETPAADRQKPAYKAFSFPFTAYTRRGVAQAWGLAPRPGTVVIERRARGGWRRVTTARARRDRRFGKPVRVPPRAVLRARQGRGTSLSWPVFDPGA